MAYFQGLWYSAECADCPLQADVKVYPDGAVPASLVFIVDWPSDADKAQGRYLLGPAGELLWLLANQAGIKREEIWTTGAMLCKPRRVKLGSGAVLPETIVQQIAARCCRTRLLQEIKHVGAQVLVPFGKWAIKAVTTISDPKVYSYRGAVIQSDLDHLLRIK